MPTPAFHCSSLIRKLSKYKRSSRKELNLRTELFTITESSINKKSFITIFRFLRYGLKMIFKLLKINLTLLSKSIITETKIRALNSNASLLRKSLKIYIPSFRFCFIVSSTNIHTMKVKYDSKLDNKFQVTLWHLG